MVRSSDAHDRLARYSVSEPSVLLDGLAMVESPRWHDDRLWFANWGTEEIVAVDLDGQSEVVGHGPPGLGWSIDWLPDGHLLVTGQELMRRETDGSMVRHADLRPITEYGWNEIVVDGRGNIYVNSLGFDFGAGEEPTTGIIALITPDGSARQVADGIQFPNGMTVTPDNSTLIISESFAGRLTAFDIAEDGTLLNRRAWAIGVGPDGICMDADGAIWTSSSDTRTHTGRDDSPDGEAIRVHEGGGVPPTHRSRSSDLRVHARRARASDAVHDGVRMARHRARRRGDRGSDRAGARRRRASSGAGWP